MAHDWKIRDGLLDQRVILITGAASGIGRALALAAAKLGATIILLDKTIAGLESVYDDIEQAGAPTAAIYPLNLESASPNDYIEMAEIVKKNFGRLDGIVHNAAILGALTPIAHLDPELWHQIMQTNLTAPFLLTRSCLELMQTSDDASIVFATDTVAVQPRAYWGAYAVSKAGLESFAGILADELESNTPIRVNCVDTGAVATGMRMLAYPGENRDKLKQPSDVIDPFLYLLSDDARDITGQRFDAQTSEKTSP